MIGRVLRVIAGFIVACLAAGLTMVLFVYTPLEVATDAEADRIAQMALLALAAATHSAVFAAPFVFIGATYGEWHRIGGWLYYALLAIAIAAVGFFVQSWAETGSEGSILNSYAVAAFIAAGVVAGTVYWLVAGRFAAPGGGGPASEARAAPHADPADATSARAAG